LGCDRNLESYWNAPVSTALSCRNHDAWLLPAVRKCPLTARGRRYCHVDDELPHELVPPSCAALCLMSRRISSPLASQSLRVGISTPATAATSPPGDTSGSHPRFQRVGQRRRLREQPSRRSPFGTPRPTRGFRMLGGATRKRSAPALRGAPAPVSVVGGETPAALSLCARENLFAPRHKPRDHGEVGAQHLLHHGKVARPAPGLRQQARRRSAQPDSEPPKRFSRARSVRGGTGVGHRQTALAVSIRKPASSGSRSADTVSS
jgi:hypothetical protein